MFDMQNFWPRTLEQINKSKTYFWAIDFYLRAAKCSNNNFGFCCSFVSNGKSRRPLVFDALFLHSFRCASDNTQTNKKMYKKMRENFHRNMKYQWFGTPWHIQKFLHSDSVVVCVCVCWNAGGECWQNPEFLYHHPSFAPMPSPISGSKRGNFSYKISHSDRAHSPGLGCRRCSVFMGLESQPSQSNKSSMVEASEIE